jgi:hypothetical protein
VKLTQTTLDYYRQRQRLPSWASKITRHKYRPDEKLISIDQVLNSQWGLRLEHTFCAHNTMNLCRYYIKKGNLFEELARLMDEPGTIIESKRRSAYARKWLYRLIVNRFPVGTEVTMHKFYGYFKALGGFTSKAVVKRIDTKFVTIEGIHGAMTIPMADFSKGCKDIFAEN